MAAETREFEFVEGTSDKFWRVTLDGADLTVTFGRRGTNGQSKTKTFESEGAARKECNALVAEKTKKGYVEVTAGTAPAATTGPKPAAAKPAAATTPPAAAATAPAPKAPAPAVVEVVSAQVSAAASAGAGPDAPAYVAPTGSPWRPKHLDREAFIRTYVDLDPLPRTPRAFDMGAVELEFKSLKTRDPRAPLAMLDVEMTREEAMFWCSLEVRPSHYPRSKARGADTMTPKEVVDLCLADWSLPLVLPFAFQAFGEKQLEEDFLPEFAGKFRSSRLGQIPVYAVNAVEQFRLTVLPYLSRDFRGRLRDAMRKRSNPSEGASATNVLAAMLGAHDVASAAAAAAAPIDALLLPLVLALGSPEEIHAVALKKKLTLDTPSHVRDWQLHFGATRGDVIARSVALASSRELASGLFGPMLNATGSADELEIVEPMLTVFLESPKCSPDAWTWMTKNVALAAHGLDLIARRGGSLAGEAARVRRTLLLETQGRPAVGPELFRKLAKIQRPPALKLDGCRLPAGVAWKPPARKGGKPLLGDPQPLPRTRPFDREAVVNSILTLGKKIESTDLLYYLGGMQWPAEEARIILRLAMQNKKSGPGREEVMKTSSDPLSKAEMAQLHATLKTQNSAMQFLRGKATPLLRSAVGTLEATRICCEGLYSSWNGVPVESVREHVLAFLTLEERGVLARELLARTSALSQLPSGLRHYSGKAGVFKNVVHDSVEHWLPVIVLGLLGHAAEVDRLVGAWPDGLFASTSHAIHHPGVFLPLLPPDRIVHHAVRLRTPMESAEEMQRIADLCGEDALNVFASCIRCARDAEQVKRLFGGIAGYSSPELVLAVFEAANTAKARTAAKGWLGTHLRETLAVLVHEIATQGPLSSRARRYLRAQRETRGEEIRAAAAAYGPEVAARIEGEVLAGGSGLSREALWQMAASLAKTKLKTLPAWIIMSDLPELSAGEWTFDAEETGLLLLALAESSLDAPHELATAAREYIPVKSREPWAWRLFEHWLRGGAPAKDKWGFTSLGLLGDNMTALKLGPLIREWPGESQTARAVLGLEVLRTIGSDVAIQQVNGIATKCKFAGLKKNAQEAMDSIAAARNLTKDQLEDRIIPDCGLDANGTAVYDFGPRQFTLVLDEELKVRARYPDGQLKPDIPKPGAKDDPAKSAEAAAAWKLTKKIVQETAKAQGRRLEIAMVSGRRWAPEEFTALFVEHPLMVSLVRRLIWGAWDEDGHLIGSFRLAEDGTFANSRDELEDPSGAAVVGVLHPLHLTPEERAAWGVVFSDYAIVPPFPQATRETFGLADAERDAPCIERFGNRQIEGAYLIFGLEAAGWQRGSAQDGGGFYSHQRVFEAADMTAIVSYEPGSFYGADPKEIEKQTIGKIEFYAGRHEKGAVWNQKPLAKLGDLDPVVVSEVIRDLKYLYDKAV